MKNLIDSKKVLVFMILSIVIIGLSYVLLFSNKTANKTTDKKEILQNDVIPTVDKSVIVDLKKEANGYDVTLAIKGIPGDTDKLEYELAYDTAEQGSQGIGPSEVDKSKINNNEYEKKFTLGTCSSGKCVYHKVVGKIKLQIRFTGGYGEKIFENEYDI